MSLPRGMRMLDVFLNYACQAKCAFCYNPPLTPELVRWKLPLDKLAGELLRGSQLGYRGVTFSGGEVTLLKDLPKILRLARRIGYQSVGIISNGVRLSEAAYAGKLKEAGLSFCCISIHGAEPALHDRMVVLPGAFVKVLRALKHLKGLEVPVVLNFVVTRENVSAAASFVERFGPEAGVTELQLYYPHFEGMMAVNAERLRIGMSEAVPHLSRAMEAARRSGVEEKVWVYNIPPCAAPVLWPRLRNWEEEEDSLLVDPEGLKSGTCLAERRDRVKIPACAGCAVESRCLGFERGYAQRFATAGMRPLEAVA